MALWDINGDIVYSEGSLGLDPKIANGAMVRRHFYKVPYSALGNGGLFEKEGKLFHTPSWTEVHPKTELTDIIVDKKPFDEIFVEPKIWEFKSESSDKVYTVKINAKGNLSCNCWGYIGHRSCKHVKEVKTYEDIGYINT